MLPKRAPEIRQLAAEGKLEWVQRAFEAADLDGNFLVIAATDSPEVNARSIGASVERGILCNSVDDIPNCDFFLVRWSVAATLQIAISTAGQSPAVAQRLRREIDEQLPQDLGPWLEALANCGARFLKYIRAARRASPCCINWPIARFASPNLAHRGSWRSRRLDR